MSIYRICFLTYCAFTSIPKPRQGVGGSACTSISDCFCNSFEYIYRWIKLRHCHNYTSSLECHTIVLYNISLSLFSSSTKLFHFYSPSDSRLQRVYILYLVQLIHRFLSPHPLLLSIQGPFHFLWKRRSA